MSKMNSNIGRVKNTRKCNIKKDIFLYFFHAALVFFIIKNKRTNKIIDNTIKE